MDLETENRIAAILLKEAAELRRQAEQEGVHAYLHQHKVRGRPNSRFLTATVLGVQQANRAVEINEMWRVRQKELELDDRLKGRLKDESSRSRNLRGVSESQRSNSKRHIDNEANATASSSCKGVVQDGPPREDEGLKEDEVEEFLHSRVKRGRGDVGSRMDETGPYLPSCSDSKGKQLASPDVVGIKERLERRVVLGPEKPSSLKSYESCDSEEEFFWDMRKKAKKFGLSKQDSRKQRSKEKSRDKKEKEKEKKKKKKRVEEKRCKKHRK